MFNLRQNVYQVLKLLAQPKYTKFLKSTTQVFNTQQIIFKNIVENNRDCQFGNLFKFSSINSINDFKSLIPISDYDFYEPFVKQQFNGEDKVLSSQNPFMFATTSGTTNNQKLIPINRSYINYFREASVLSGFNLLNQFPKLSNGFTLSIFGSACDYYSKSNLPVGSISGALMKSEPKIVQKFISPIPYEIAEIKDWDTKYYLWLLIGLNYNLTCIYTLNPSTILLLCQNLEKNSTKLIKNIFDGTIPFDLNLNINFKSDKPKARYLENLLNHNKFIPKYIWPQLQVVSSWTKAGASYYIEPLKKYFLDIPIVDISYGASEGRGSIYFDNNTQLLAINSHFYEFVSEDEEITPHSKTLLAHELEIGKNYQIIFTTQAGLYRYNIGDIVKVTGFVNQCPAIEFSHKKNNISSLTGEKITENQVVEAFKILCKNINCSFKYFCVIPHLESIGYYKLYIEPESSLTDINLEIIANYFDEYLRRLNIEYDHKRNSLRLDSIRPVRLRIGTYNTIREYLHSTGSSDAQIKISHLKPKRQIEEFILKNIEN